MNNKEFFTAADEILCEESLEKYKNNNPYFVELYNQINEIFPEKFKYIGGKNINETRNIFKNM